MHQPREALMRSENGHHELNKSDKSQGSDQSERDREHVSLRQLNEDRLKHLTGRFGEELPFAPSEPTSKDEHQPSAFENFQASVPDSAKSASPSTTFQNLQRKFSTSWLNMQTYLGDKKQNRDWDTKFK